MLLKKDNEPVIDYMSNWPEHYYEIEHASDKLNCLQKAIEQQLNPPYDTYRKKLLEKRFFSHDKKNNVDTFMHAWMMIKASTLIHVSFLQKKKAKKELEIYMEELCILHFVPECPEEQQVLEAEWADFSRQFIASCVGSKAYCSTLFGFVPINDTTIAEKIVNDINQITKEYPSQFEYETTFQPFRQIMIQTFCQMIENGESYWEM